MKINMNPISLKPLLVSVLFLIWMILTILLLCSILGLCILMASESGRRSTWMEIGIDFKNYLIK